MKKRKRAPQEEAQFYSMEKIASFTECTGLKAIPPQTPQQDEALSELYAAHPATPEGKTGE